MTEPNWSDIRVFLAVAEHGTLRAAGRALSVTQPTVGRHIRSLEQSLGMPLFEKGRAGHRLTDAGRELHPRALEMQAAVAGLKKRGAELSAPAARIVHVSANPWPAMVLSRHATALIDGGGPRFEVSVSENTDHLARREADIAVRHGLPKTGDLVTRKIGNLDCAIYGDKAMAARAGALGEAGWFAELPWVAFTEAQAHYQSMQWLERRLPNRGPTLRIERTGLILDAAAGGAGLAILPCAIADGDPRLIRISAPLRELRADYWMITHRDLSRTPQVRAAIDIIVKMFKGLRA